MRALVGVGCVLAAMLPACRRDGARTEPEAGGGAAPSKADASASPPHAGPGEDGGASRDDGRRANESPEAGASACPGDMVHVRTSYCPRIERRCLDLEHEEKNHLQICHAYAHEQSCREAERPISFCIDRYEYPNQKGAHPVWMLNGYQAQATCESKGKRLCWASEWTAACEGPEHLPFPYGWERDHDKCNMDNFYIDPKRPAPRAQFFFYSKTEDVALRELSRLDQSVPSGSIPACQSGFGVYDMPGNLDEWVVSDVAPREKSKWAGLKGGAWGHVRSQCRPMTFSHEPEFYYYFVGFRCCRDAEGDPPEERWTPSPDALPPPAVEAHDFAPDPIVPIAPPGPSKVKYSRTGRAE